MKSPLEQIQSLEEAICQLRKIDSKLDAGQIIRAFRENGKLIASFERAKIDIVNAAKNRKPDEQLENNILEHIQDLEEVIRQLHKISSLIYVGQIVAASGNNNKLISALKRKLSSMTYEMQRRKNDK